MPTDWQQTQLTPVAKSRRSRQSARTVSARLDAVAGESVQRTVVWKPWPSAQRYHRSTVTYLTRESTLTRRLINESFIARPATGYLSCTAAWSCHNRPAKDVVAFNNYRPTRSPSSSTLTSHHRGGLSFFTTRDKNTREKSDEIAQMFEACSLLR